MRSVQRAALIVLAATALLSAAACTQDEPAVTSTAAPDSGLAIGPELLGGLSARNIGPAVMSGRIAALDVVAADPRIIYAGAAGGGVWQSKNGGVTFKSVFDDHNQCIGAIAIDQAHPDTVWVGTGEPWVRNSVSVGDGVYRTSNAGEKWLRVGLEQTERIGKIVVHPNHSATVYVAALGQLWAANEERGLYRTDDSGQSWRKLLYVDENTGCSDVAVDPQRPQIVYAAMWQFRRSPDFFTSGGPGSGLYKSEDGGETWRKLTRGLPVGELGRIAVAIAPADPRVVYAAIEAEETAFYRSADRGESWTLKSDAQGVKTRPFYFNLIIPDPQDPDRVYKTGGGLLVTRDGGHTFSGVGGWVHPDYHAMWINPAEPNHLIVGTDGGIYISHNRGGDWRFVRNLPVSQFYRVTCDDRQPFNVYGGLQDNGTWYAPTRAPAGIENEDWQVLGGGDGFAVAVDRRDDNIVYWEWQGGNINRRDMVTGESKDIKPLPAAGEPEYRFNWNTPIATSLTAPDRLYVGSQFLHRSRDRGESWQRLSDDLTTNDPAKQRQLESGGLTVDNTTAENHCTIFTICESPRDKAVIWVGTDDGNVQVTSDDGRTWQEVSDRIDGLPDGTWVSCIEASPHERAGALATFDGHRTGDKRPYVYATSDLGRTWRSLATETITGYAHVVRQDPVNPDLLYLGTESGLYVTLDGGRHWARFEEEFPPVSVRDLAIQARESSLVIATHGRGIYIIDDVSPLRQLTAGMLAAEVALLASPPTILRTPQYKQQFPGDDHFVAGNATGAATIIYHLQKRHLFGDMKLEIFTADGELLKTLPGGKRKGLNIVRWSPRKKPPKVAPSPVLDPATTFAAMFGPTAPEGRYTYQLTKGDEVYSGELELRYDPASPHSAADRAMQQQAVTQLYDLLADLSYVCEAMAAARDDARDRAAQPAATGALATDLAAFADTLDGQHQTLMVTEEVQGISGRKELREKVVRLYAAVSQYGGRPSRSQQDRLDAFAQDIATAGATFRQTIAQYLPDLNRRLAAAELDTVALLTAEEYAARE